MNWILPALVVFVLLLPMRMIMTTFHEAGHAIAAALSGSDKVKIYLGSYGDEVASRKITGGRFELWVRANLLLWAGGLCTYSSEKLSARQKVICIIGGPAATLFLFVILLGLFLYLKPAGTPGVVLCVFCIWVAFSFLYNIVPRNINMHLANGALIRNDGMQLESLLRLNKLPGSYQDAVRLLKEKKYADAVPILESIIRSGTKYPDVYRNAIHGYMMLKDFRRADALQKEQIIKIGNIGAGDRVTLALLKMNLGNYDEAIAYYRHLLQTGGGNKYNLNNFGYLLTLVNRFEEAIPVLDKAIAIDGQCAYAYSNRGYARIMLGKAEEGKQDLTRALELDPTNPIAYRNVGIYYFNKGLYAEAISEFNKAAEIDADTPLVQDYVNRTMEYLRLSKSIG